jgi:hypothetical protein
MVLAASLLLMGVLGTVFVAIGSLMVPRWSSSAAPSSAPSSTPARPSIEISGFIDRHVTTAPGTCLVRLTITNNTGYTIRDLQITHLSLDGNPPIGVRLPLQVCSLAPGASHQMSLTFKRRFPSRPTASLKYDIDWSHGFWGIRMGGGSVSGSTTIGLCR